MNQDRAKKFEFEGGGSLLLEMLDGGALLLQLTAFHPGQATKVTSSSVIVDAEKAKEIQIWLAQQQLTEENS